MIVLRHYENISVLHENRMPERAYYIPASCRLDNPAENRGASDRMQLLNGIWKFRYYDSIYDLSDKFYEADYPVADYDDMAVPGVWQMAGYDTHQYTNVRYPFPFDPPYVPQDVPCGAYVYDFVYETDEGAPRAYLNFEGVDSCFYVWINGIYVGYSQVSHMTSEFDVTGVLMDGTNRIAVLVMKWCDGSYLEDQDKFRMSGIIRDVYILKRPEQCVFDYHITQENRENVSRVNVDFKYLQRNVDTRIVVYDGAGLIKEVRVEGGRASIDIENPTLWNPENPYLYTLLIETENECITEQLALRTIELRDKVVYLNGQKIKFNGVNRHDADPVTGPVISLEHMKRDLQMMKQHNFNAIRTSHYPNAPFFYHLCERYGFLVCDEADVEAHGPCLVYRKEDTDYERFKRWNEAIADNPEWEEAIMDRVRLMAQRDKNRFCIVMWSVGNESAYGCNFEKALSWIKQFDPDRITQYESARYRNYDVTYNYDNLDLYSRMYPGLNEIEDYLKRDAKKPFLLVEYCHSMGNGPGDFEDYFQMIQENDIMCGGFVWEWCDHAVEKGVADDGRTVYYYGGDHGETIHDGNFCVDGLVYPDRRPHTGLLEYKNVYRPARIVSYDEATGELALHNYMMFTNLSDYADICYELSCDGVVTESGELPPFSVEPLSDGVTRLKLDIPAKGKVYLKLIYRLKIGTEIVPRHHMLGFDELLLHNEDGRNQTALGLLECGREAGDIEVAENDFAVVLKSKEFCYKYSKKSGLLESLRLGDREYLERPMELNIWRAPTDNDMYIKSEWKKAHYNEAYVRAYDTLIHKTDAGVDIEVDAMLGAATVQKMMDVKLLWHIDRQGGISACIDVKRDTEFPALPRFGVRLFLNEGFDDVTYYGMGPYESYCDKHRASSHGIYHARVDELHEDYIKPQENGSHYDCDYVRLCDGGNGLNVVSEKAFSFNVSCYTQEELEDALHNYQLVKSGFTVLCVDYGQNGIGSNSCGPRVLEKYRLDDEAFTFQFKMMPEGDDKN